MSIRWMAGLVSWILGRLVGWLVIVCLQVSLLVGWLFVGWWEVLLVGCLLGSMVSLLVG